MTCKLASGGREPAWSAAGSPLGSATPGTWFMRGDVGTVIHTSGMNSVTGRAPQTALKPHSSPVTVVRSARASTTFPGDHTARQQSRSRGGSSVPPEPLRPTQVSLECPLPSVRHRVLDFLGVGAPRRAPSPASGSARTGRPRSLPSCCHRGGCAKVKRSPGDRGGRLCAAPGADLSSAGEEVIPRARDTAHRQHWRQSSVARREQSWPKQAISCAGYIVQGQVRRKCSRSCSEGKLPKGLAGHALEPEG